MRKQQKENANVIALKKKIARLEKSLDTLQLKYEKAEQGHSQWESFFKRTSAHVFQLDLLGHILSVNRVNKTISKKNIIGRKLFDFIEDSFRPSFRKKFTQAIRTQKSHIVELKGGETPALVRWYLIHIIPVVVNKKVKSIILLALDITDRKMTEASLIQSEERFRSLSDLSTEGIIIHQNGFVIEANKIASQFVGVSEKSMKGINMMKFLDPLQKNRVFKQLQKSVATVPLELSVKNGHGETTILNTWGKNIFYRGEPARVSVFHNVTEAKGYERKLLESEEKFRRLSEATFEAIIIHDNGKIIQVNDACCKMFGYSEDELIGKSVLELATADTRHIIMQSVLDQRETAYEAKGLRKDGSFFYGEVRAKQANYKGKVIRVGTVRDITERKMTEQVLKENERTLSLILTNIDELVYYVEFSDPNKYEIKYIGNQIEKLIGITKEEYISSRESLIKECHPDDIPLIEKTYKNIKHQKRPHLFVYRFMHRVKKTYVWIEERIIPQLDADSKHIANFGVMRDVTEHKEYETQIEQSRENYRNLIEYSPDGIFIHDERGEVLFANPNMLRMMGINSLDELPSRNILHYVSENYQQMIKDRKANLLSGESVPFTDMQVKRPDKSIIEIESKPILVNYNGSPATLVVCHNVSVQRMLEREKMRAQIAEETSDKIRQSLREKEVLLKEVHHRVKNNLQVISSILNLQSSYVKDTNTLNILKESQNRIKSMAFIHESLYQNKDLTSINFSGYVGNLAQNLFQSFSISGNRIRLEMELDDVQLNLDYAIPTGLIINELVSNALKYAFPETSKGTIFIGLQMNNQVINLTVADNGVGLPQGLDFRNTESLGLQLVTTLVEQLEGNIKLENVNGAKFLITFNAQKNK